jgi:hypothetical protein
MEAFRLAKRAGELVPAGPNRYRVEAAVALVVQGGSGAESAGLGVGHALGVMAENAHPRALLARNIEAAAARVAEGRLRVAWAGEQLAALVRLWGYSGHDRPMPESFEEFDHVMTDLECFPDGRMANDEHIRQAAAAVFSSQRPRG